jgi:uncharacterized membrane protein
MKIFGHPVHLMVLHFPAALLPMEFICYILYYINHDTSYAFASLYAMAGGVLLGWIAALSGIMDLLKIPVNKEKALAQAFIHGGIQGSVLIAYTLFLYLAWKKYPGPQEISLVFLIGKGLLIIAMIVGNYLGGNLILRYKVGIEN